MTELFSPAEMIAPDPLVVRGRYVVRLAASDTDLARAYQLRHRCFFAGAEGLDRDGFDAACLHVLIEEAEGKALAGCFRLMPMATGADLHRSYAAQFHDLSGLAGQPGPMLELGRFCVAPQSPDADVLRLAWGALAVIVDSLNVRMLFGSSSFAGTDPAPYRDGFALLRQRHLGPEDLRPRVIASHSVPFPDAPVDPLSGLRQLPPLLRTYLSMGGWVGDRAIVDRQMNTLHVFTGLAIDAIPARRAAALRAIAGL